MTAGGNPWSDPATPTEPGAPYGGAPYGGAPYGGPPYGGPPPTAPPPPGHPQYGHPQYGYGQPYGYPPYPPWPAGAPSPWAPAGPRRPGQVVASAVLAFVQAALVVLASLYVWFFASVAGFAVSGGRGGYSSDTVRAMATEGPPLAVVQLLSTVVLVATGILALSRRTRGVWLGLVIGHALQLLIAGYWAVRLSALLGDLAGPSSAGALGTMTLFFAVAPIVGLGLLLIGPGRHWFDGTAQR
jgi:hypothetical protein